VQADHLRLAAQELFQGTKLSFATDERDAPPLGDRRGDDRSIHGARPAVQGRVQTRETTATGSLRLKTDFGMLER